MSSGADERPQREEAGFTLVETLVALVILGLAVVMLHQVFAAGWSGVRRARLEAAAAGIAVARLEAAGIVTPLADGFTDEGSEGAFRWRVTMAARPEEAVASGQGGGSSLAGTWVTVDVTWQDGTDGTLRSIRLTTLKIGPRP
jgi:prepilin-type N-terminal cleavage/methylation domain-containing protein